MRQCRAHFRRTMAVTVLAGLVGFSPAAHADAPLKLEDTPTLNVRGDCTLQKPADQIELRIGVVTQAEEADAALEENSSRMLSVVEALERAGLSDREYKTGRFSIQPQYTPRPRQPPDNWSPKIIGYQVQNSIEVRTKRIDAAGDLIKVANRAGANSVDFMGFSLSNPRAYQAEAIAEATKNAMTDAQVLADAAGLRLVRIINIDLNSAQPSPVGGRMMRAEMAMAADSAPPISGGDIPIRASVNISYEILPSH